MIDESQVGSQGAGEASERSGAHPGAQPASQPASQPGTGAPVEFRQCPSCGTFGYAGDRFCAHCGAGLPAGCARCGAPNTHPIAFYCTACGAELLAETTKDRTPSRHDTIKGES